MRQRPVLEAILHDDADVAAVDGYAFDLLRRHAPDVAGQFRVVATTEPAPSPPMVASPGVDPATRTRVSEALLVAHEARELEQTRDDLLLLRFDRAAPASFERLLDWQRAAEAAGYPKLA